MSILVYPTDSVKSVEHAFFQQCPFLAFYFCPVYHLIFLLAAIIARVLDSAYYLASETHVPRIISGPRTHSMVLRHALGRSMDQTCSSQRFYSSREWRIELRGTSGFPKLQWDHPSDNI